MLANRRSGESGQALLADPKTLTKDQPRQPKMPGMMEGAGAIHCPKRPCRHRTPNGSFRNRGEAPTASDRNA